MRLMVIRGFLVLGIRLVLDLLIYLGMMQGKGFASLQLLSIGSLIF